MRQLWTATIARVDVGQIDTIAHLLALDFQTLPPEPGVYLHVVTPPADPCLLYLILRWLNPAALVQQHPLITSALEPLHGRGRNKTLRTLSQSATFLMAVRTSVVCGRAYYLAYADQYRYSAALELRAGALHAGYAIDARSRGEVVTLDGDMVLGASTYAQAFDTAVSHIFGDLTTREELIQRYYWGGSPVIERRLV